MEMMIAVLVLSIGLLGIAGLQTATAKYKVNTWARASVSTLLSDLAERVRINPDEAGTSFAAAGVASPSAYVVNANWAAQQADDLTISKNCETTACTSGERATFDLLTWRKKLRYSMPQGAAVVAGDRRNGIDVTMMWFDKENVGTDGVLKAPPTCSGTEKGMAQQSCCPAAATVPAGVRCARFTFVP